MINIGRNQLIAGLVERRSSVLAFTACFIAMTWAVGPCSAQSEEVHISPRSAFVEGSARTRPALTDTFHARVDLVLIPVTVRDEMDRQVLGLDRDNFQVFENKQLQSVEHFSAEDGPVSLVVILDTSGSMSSSNKIEKAREAVLEFLRSSNPQDEISLITVSDKPQLKTEFTKSIETVQSTLIATVARGHTALLDSIYLALNEMKDAMYARRAILIISDGGDNASRYTEREVTERVRESDVIIYSIGVYDRSFSSEEERLGPMLLGDITEVTGGRLFTLDNPNDIPEVAFKIGTELRNQYFLGYRPRNPPRDGKWHNLKVKVKVPKGFPRLQVTAKKGYYAAGK